MQESWTGRRTFCLRLEARRLLLFVSGWQSLWGCMKRTLSGWSASFPFNVGGMGDADLGEIARDVDQKGDEEVVV